jgi:putative flippase GtrA
VKLPVSPQFGRFLLVGGIAAVINVVSRVIYGAWVNYSLSIVLAYLTGMVAAFFMTRRFVFPPGRNGVGCSAAIFALVNAVALLQIWGVSITLADHVCPALGMGQHSETTAHVIGVGVPAFTSYIGHRKWSFR